MPHGPVLSQIVTLNKLLYTFGEFSEVPISSDVCQILRKASLCHYRFLLLIRVQGQTTTRDLFSVDVQCKILEIIMAENYGFVSMEPRKSLSFTIVNKILLGMWPRTVLSMDSE